MKLYIFSVSTWGKFRLTMEEMEVEEKNKIYQSKYRRINKSEIGVVSGYRNDTCILLENDPKKASEILIVQKQKELETIKSSMERKQSEIDMLNSYIEN